MAYGHAERTLATIRLLEAETRDLLSRQEDLEPEQAEWLRQAAESASRRLRSGLAVVTRLGITRWRSLITARVITAVRLRSFRISGRAEPRAA